MIPNKVKVGGVDYTVEEVKNLITKNDAWGEVHFFDSTITIDDSLSASRKEQVLIHEVTHAIFLEAGYKEQEEDMINRLSIVLHQVLKDNPNLLNPLANLTHLEVSAIELELTEEMKELLSTPLTTLGVKA